MGKKLPEEIVEDLNAAGMGGRLVYIPLRNRAKTLSDKIYETMLNTLKSGKSIELDDFQNMVSLRTLYRLKKKAIKSFESFKQATDKKTEEEQICW
jgi:nucleoid DNA-binding protein